MWRIIVQYQINHFLVSATMVNEELPKVFKATPRFKVEYR